jgi:acyl carrier protein
MTDPETSIEPHPASIHTTREDSPTGSEAADVDTREQSLSKLWGEILGVDVVDPAADFTELGGNSLHAARLVARIRTRYGTELPLRELFDARTVGGLARLVARRGAARPAGRTPGTSLPPVHRDPASAPVPSLSQQRLWFLDRLNAAAGVAYNVPMVARVRGPLDLTALRGALDDVVRRHEQLRTSFHLVDGRLAVRVEDVLPSVGVIDLRHHRDPEHEALQQSERLAAEHLDLGTVPLLRCAVFRVGEDLHLVAIVLHHMVSDGWTVDVIDRELAEAYRARTENDRARLPEPRLEYRDFARWSTGVPGSRGRPPSWTCPRTTRAPRCAATGAGALTGAPRRAC